MIVQSSGFTWKKAQISTRDGSVMRKTVFMLAMLAATWPVSQAQAADVAAGQVKAEPCAACHGANGVSVSDDIPNLAGQKAKYLASQLTAFKAEKRKNLIMNAIATQLSDADIADLAAFWNSLPAAGGTQTSELMPAITKTRVTFPQNYKKNFTHYTTINFEAKKQVRRYYANDVAIKAAREGKPMGEGAILFVEGYMTKLDAAGKPVMGSDGLLVADKPDPSFYTAMQIGKGWGDDIPDLYRNGDWNYAVFKGDKSLKAGVNQAKCFACHKPLAKDSYVFSLDKLLAAIK